MRLAPMLFALMLALAGLAAPAQAQYGDIHFGDNTSDYANNGECDDPRFAGEGMASILTVTDRMRDAVDCEAGVKAGKLTFEPMPFYRGQGRPPTMGEIRFGDDASAYANDRSCDDSRFGGRLMASVLIEGDIGHDATDCRTGMVQGELVYLGTAGRPYAPDIAVSATAIAAPPARPATDLSGIDFGDNSSSFANNGQCDDRRFSGTGMATFLIASDILHDAADCQAAMRAGTVTYRQPQSGAAAMANIDFGDDSSGYAGNSECDDPRFQGESMATILLDDDMGHDATDCRSLMASGSIEYIGAPD